MSIFRRGPKPRFPADMLEWLDAFGRHSLDPQHSNVPEFVTADVWSRLGPLLESMKQDPDGFFTELRAIVAADRGGFATWGAARLAWELLGGDVLRTAAALPLIDAGIEFKLARGLGRMSLTGYEHQRLGETRRQAELAQPVTMSAPEEAGE